MLYTKLFIIKVMFLVFGLQSIDHMAARGHELYLVDNAEGKLIYMNHSKPAILLEKAKIADILYTRTTSADIQGKFSVKEKLKL